MLLLWKCVSRLEISTSFFSTNMLHVFDCLCQQLHREGLGLDSVV